MSSPSGKKPLSPLLARTIAIRAIDRPFMQKYLLFILNSRADNHHTCWPTIDRIVADSGLARSTVIKTMNTLRELGLVIRTRTGDHNHRNVYKLNLFKMESTVRAACPIGTGVDSPGEVINESVRRTRTSPSQVSTSPANGHVESVRQTRLSIKDSVKESIEGALLTHPDPKEIEILTRWLEVLNNIDLPDQSISTWFVRFQPVDLTDGWLTIETDSDYVLRWVRKHYLKELVAMKTVTKISEEVLHDQPA